MTLSATKRDKPQHLDTFARAWVINCDGDDYLLPVPVSLGILTFIIILLPVKRIIK